LRNEAQILTALLGIATILGFCWVAEGVHNFGKCTPRRQHWLVTSDTNVGPAFFSAPYFCPTTERSIWQMAGSERSWVPPKLGAADNLETIILGLASVRPRSRLTYSIADSHLLLSVTRAGLADTMWRAAAEQEVATDGSPAERVIRTPFRTQHGREAVTLGSAHCVVLGRRCEEV